MSVIIGNRFFRSVLTSLLLASMLTISAPLKMVVGANGVTVSVNAPDYVTPDSIFTATINITEVANFDSAGYDVSFNPSIVEVTSITGGKIGETDIPVNLWNTTEPGRITVVQNIPGVPGVSGSGYLAEIRFHVLGSPGQTTNVTLSNGILGDNTGQAILATWLGDLVRITAHQTATVSVNAPEVVYKNSNFSATIDISQVTNFDAASYNVSFNPVALQITAVTGGQIGEIAVPVNLWNETEPGRITVVQNIPGVQGTSGAGFLATLGFRVIGSEGQTSNITLANGVLSDGAAQIIPAVWIGDSIRITVPVQPVLSTMPYPPSHNFGEVPEGDSRQWVFAITNSGTGTLEWTIADDQPWITLSPTSGSTTTEADNVTVTMNTSGLAASATHSGSVAVISNGGNVTGTITVSVLALPVDLVASNLTYTPAGIADGDAVNLVVRVQNVGTGRTISDFYVRFDIDGIAVGHRRVVGGLGAGQSLELTQVWQASSGNHTATATVDENNDITESNKANNVLSVALPYVPFPDLVTSNITYSPPGDINHGDEVTFIATVKNSGAGGSSREFHVLFEVDGAYIGQQKLSGLAAGASVNVSQVWTAERGMHTVTAIADRFNTVAESNENNNRLSLALPGALAPDLVVERVNWLPSDNISDGASVTVNATVSNIGTGALAGSFFVRFEVDGTLVGRQQVTGGLVAGGSVSVATVWMAKVGIHTVKVIADEFNTVIELNEANNELSRVLPEVAATDLVVTSITWLPVANIYDGQEVTITATVNNTGAGATFKDFFVRFEIDGNYIGRQSVAGGLAIGESKNVSQKWTAQVGPHAVTAIADESNAITESNETNNRLSQPLPEVLAPDLTVTAITWLPTENISDGQPVTLTVTVNNIGTGNTSRDFYVRFEIDNTYIGHQLVTSGLAVGQAKQVSQVWTARTGIHTAKAIADENNTVTESNETNNEWSQVLPQVPTSDLVVTAITWLPTENISDGQPVTLKATVKNIGTGDTSRDFYVRFEIDGQDAGQQKVTGGLAVGQAKEVSQTWAAQVGTHTVKAIADWNNAVAESNETNNSLSQTLSEIATSDLWVGALFLPPNEWAIGDGDKTTLTAVVENIGTGNTTRDFYVRFEIDNTYVGHQLVTGGLAAGQKKHVSQVWMAAPGSHTAKAIADEGNAVAESNETNNSLSQTLPQITASDLVLTAIAWSPQAGIGDGNSVTLTATVKNIGTGNTSRDFYVSFKVDGSSVGQQLVSGGLAVGEVKVVSQVWTAAPGSHTATAIADEGSAITESDETNNSLSQALPQIAASDLVVTAITWSPQTGISDGNSVTLTTTVKNIGTGNTTRDFYVRFEVDNIYIGHQLVSDGLAVGQTKQVSQVWTAAPGSHTAKAIADEGNTIAESDETNNSLSQPLPQIAFPDLTITALSWQPVDVLHGGIVTFAATVENSGSGATSREFYVRFEVDGNLIGRQKVSGLDSSLQVYQKWLGSSGAQNVTAMADEYNVVAESSENNNSAGKALPRIPRPPQITLTTPNGGQTWYGVQNIVWTATSPEGFPLTITLELFNGSFYRPIAEYLQNSGSYQWDTRRLADGSRVNDSTQYQVRVTATDSLGVSSSDLSDTSFTIFNVPEVRISAAPGFQKTTERVVADYVLTIYNKQPYPDAFNLPVANSNSAAVAELGQGILNLDAWATATVTLKVTDETPGNYSVGVSAISQTNPEVKNTVTVQTEVIPSFTVDVQASSTVTSIGGSLEYKMVLRNQQKVADTFSISVTGIPSAWFSIGNSHLLNAGEAKIIPLPISVLDTASAGNFTVMVQAISANWNIARQGSVPLTVIAEPIISKLSPPSNTRTGATDITFIWKTSVASSSQVFIRVEGGATYNIIEKAGASGVEHTVLVLGLSRNTWYEFYVRSATVHGAAQSEVRRLFIDNGITFTQRQYYFTVEMDYAQQATVQVRNTDDEPHQLLLSIESPPPDIAVGFVGEGSRDQAITLQPGEAKNIWFAIHAQDAKVMDYTFRIELSTGGANPIYDYAYVNVHIRIPNINFTLAELGSNPVNLTKTLKLTNNGDPITNFVVAGDEKLAGLIYFNPVIDHVRLATGGSMEFKVVPILSENFSALNGNIIVQGAGTTFTLPLSFSLPEGKRVYVGSAAAALKARTNSWQYPEARIEVLEFTENRVRIRTYAPLIDDTIEWFVGITPNVSYQPTPEELAAGVGVYNPRFTMEKTGDRRLVTFRGIISGGSMDAIETGIEMGQDVKGKIEEATRYMEESARIDEAYHSGAITKDAAEILHHLNVADTVYNQGLSNLVDKVPVIGQWIDAVMENGIGAAKAGAMIAGKHAAQLEEVYAMIDGAYESKGFYCSNGVKVEPTFDIPDSVQPGNVPPKLYMKVKLYPDPRFKEVIKPHYSEPYLNGYPLGPIPDTIPNGTYLIPFPASFLNFSQAGTARNVIRLVTGNFNPGHYVVATDFTIYIPLRDVRVAVIAANQLEANQMVAAESGAMVVKPDFAIYPPDIKPGSLQLRIHNTGSLGGTTPYQVFDGNTLIYRSWEFLPRFSSATVTIPWNGTTGQHDITVRLNPDRTLTERDYSNNEATSVVYVEGADNTPPIIGNLQPPANSTTRHSRPLISADLSDAGSGVNTTSVTISVDGNNVTANATVTSSQVSYTSLVALANGLHNVVVYAADNLGNGASANWSFTVNSSPEITNPQPPPGSIIADTTPLISADLSDADWGINASSVTISLDGIGVTGNASVSSSRVWYLPATPLAGGGHNVAVSAEDNAGNSASANWSFTIPTPPLLSNVQSTNISGTTAIISWDTDKASDSLVRFGTASGNYTYQKSNSQMVLSHIIRLAGLTPETIYYYKVRSTDPIGAFSESQEYSFTTSPAWEWQRTFGGANDDRGYSVQQTFDGGYIIGGTTYSLGAGSADVYLIKTDASGNLTWQKTFGGANIDQGLSVQPTADGGYIIGGTTQSFGTGNPDVYLIKTNASGNLTWQKTFGGANNDYGDSVQPTADGGYIIAGYTSSFGAGSGDAYLIKTDASGNLTWQKTFGGANYDRGYSVRPTADGGYIIAGWTQSVGAGASDVYLIKTDASGNMIWQNTFGGASDDWGYSVQPTADGGYIIAGHTISFGVGLDDFYLIKTDASGNLTWQQTFGGANADYGSSVWPTPDGGYITVGTTYSFGAGSADVYLIKTDASGNITWSQTFGGANVDSGSSLQLTADGGYIIAGETNSFGAGGYDVWLIKVAPVALPGDANDDGVINVLDLTKVARIILLLDAETPGADANLDGMVNVLDLSKIVRLILFLPD